MEKKILYVNSDGSVAIFTKSPNCKKSLEKLAARVVPKEAVSHTIIDSSMVPVDKTYRNAWEFNGSVITHNITKAKEIHKQALRQLRADKLAKLDIEYQKADETGDAAKKAKIAAKKQKLRDITKHPEIEAAQTVEELKVAGMAELEEIQV